MSPRKAPHFEQGTAVRLRATLSASAAPVDGTVTVIVNNPNGVPLTPSVARLDVGVYYVDVPANVPGQWRYRWESTSPESAEEGSFWVDRSQVITS